MLTSVELTCSVNVGMQVKTHRTMQVTLNIECV